MTSNGVENMNTEPIQNGDGMNNSGLANGTSMAQHANQVVNQAHKMKNSELFEPPVFYQPLESEIKVDEGEPLRLLSRVGPAGDSSLCVDWYKDEKLLCAGSRFSTVMDRGFIVLDIYYTIEDDAGEYVCMAKSRSGKTESNKCRVTIVPERGTISHSQLPAEMMQNISQLDDLVMGRHAANEDEEDSRHSAKTPPQFLNQVSNTYTVQQNGPVHLEVFVEPAHDSGLMIDWFKDGKPVLSGSRINTIFDRGYCSMDIAYCYPEDSGQYTCVAKNSLGQVESMPTTIVCNPEEAVVTKSNLNESSIQNLKAFENPGDEFNMNFADTKQIIEPSFINEIQPNTLSVVDGEPVYLSVKIDPGNGEKLSFDWYHNDQVIDTCSRLTGKVEMNQASLKIQYTLLTDTGSYKCVIFTEHGRAESNIVNLTVEPEQSIISAPQSKGIEAIQALEAELNAPRTRQVVDETITDIPSFPIQPKPIEEQLVEGDSITLRASVQPVKDNSLAVEWYKNEEQLMNGARFRIDYERGVASLLVTSLVEEDSGVYYIVATNKNGSTTSDKIEINCTKTETIVTKSSLLEDSDGFKRIKEMEEDLANVNTTATGFRNFEEEEEESAPKFDVKPMNIEVGEGCPAKFLVKVGGFPRPELSWSIDGETVVSDSVIKAYNDGSINYLEINRCQELGQSVVQVTATNTLGSATAEATLTVVQTVMFKQDGLKRITPENPYKKMADLKKVGCTDELANAFKKNRPSAETISNMEKGRYNKPQDVVETEKMYDQIASGLRKSTPLNHPGSRGRSPYPTSPLSPQANAAPVNDTSPATNGTESTPANAE